MRQLFLKIPLSAGLIFGTAVPSIAATTAVRDEGRQHRYSAQSHYIRHRRHVNTAGRVGIGAAGAQ
jgi:hypothetical protein